MPSKAVRTKQAGRVYARARQGAGGMVSPRGLKSEFLDMPQRKDGDSLSEIAVAFGLTLFAGLATGIGSAIAFFAKRTNFRFLSISTGFSAGVMLYVSFVEIFFKGSEALTEVYGDHWGNWINVGAFFGGIILIGLIDAFIPQAENPHEVRSERDGCPVAQQ